MTTRSVRLSLALVWALGAIPALADHEGPGAHAGHGTQTVTLDGHDVRPSTTTMEHGDVVTFVNYSTHPVQVTFTEPADLKDKIRCGLVRGKETEAPAAPWALFTWRGDKLVGNVPPGTFASVCSLEPGSYAFTATILGVGSHVPAGVSGVLPPKGQIVVK